MNPDASLITFLTISEQDSENIFFIYIREINDIAPSKVCWYQKFGQGSESIYLWEKHKIKQWVAIGSDSEINEIWQQFFTKSEINIAFSGKKEIVKKFNLPSILITSEYVEDDIYRIPSVNRFENQKAFYTTEDWENRIGSNLPFLFEPKTLSEFEGYKKSSEITPIYPPGLFESGFLFEVINKAFSKTGKGVICVHEKRGIHESFHGLLEDENSNPNGFIGFIQAEPDERSNLIAAIADLDDNHLTKSDIDINTGIWKINPGIPLDQGRYYLIDKTNDTKIYGQNFYILKNISVNMGIVRKEYEDLFGRKFKETDIKKPEKIEKILPKNFYWLESSYSNPQTSYLDLSDKLIEIISFLSPTIIISDPYLLGEIKNEKGKAKIINNSQKVFINALFTAAFKGSIKEIRLLGYRKNFKKFIDSGTFDEILENYKVLFKEMSNFNIERVALRFSKQPFHDRYWVGLENDKSQIFRITNSISGLVESGELGVTNVSEPVEKLKVFNIISSRWEKSTETDEEVEIYARPV